MKKAAFIVVLFLLIIPSQGQSIEHYLTFAPQWSYLSNKDDLMSPLTYRGHHGALRTGYKRMNQKGTVNEVYGTFSLGYIQSDIYPDFHSRALSSMGEITYVRLVKMSDSTLGFPVKFKMGINWHNQVYAKDNLRFTNNSFLMDFNSTLAIASRLSNDFKLFNRNFSVNANVSFALFNFIQRPAYASSSPESELSEDNNPVSAFLKSGKFETIADYQQVMTELNLIYYLKNGNGIRLRYGWLFAHYEEVSEMFEASHAISVSTLFKL